MEPPFPVSASQSPSPRDWAHGIPQLVLHLISHNITSITDYVRFRAVCVPWRSAALPNPPHLPPQLPWLMIPYYPNPDDDNGVRLFYDLWQSKMLKIHLPDTIGKMCCASYRGWLLLVAPTDKELLLLNPITGSQVQLPAFTMPVKVLGYDERSRHVLFDGSGWFLPENGNFVISKLSFSIDPTDPYCVVMVYLQRLGQLFFCKVGDPCWTVVNLLPEGSRNGKFGDATYHNRRFYLLSHAGVITVYDLSNPRKRVMFLFPPELQSATKIMLEGKSGVYIVLVHNIFIEELVHNQVEEEEELANQDDPSHDANADDKAPRKKIELYELVTEPLELKQVMETSDTTIFFGDNHHCLAVRSDDWDSLAGDCMYEEHVCAPTAAKDEDELCYAIYRTKMGISTPELVVGDIGECRQLRPAAPAIWFQPSFV